MGNMPWSSSENECTSLMRRLVSTSPSASTFRLLFDSASASSSLLSESKRGVETAGDDLFRLDELASLTRAFGSLLLGRAGDAFFWGLGAPPLTTLGLPFDREGEGFGVSWESCSFCSVVDGAVLMVCEWTFCFCAVRGFRPLPTIPSNGPILISDQHWSQNALM
jgi:hypothetical protein